MRCGQREWKKFNCRMRANIEAITLRAESGRSLLEPVLDADRFFARHFHGGHVGRKRGVFYLDAISAGR